MHIGRQITFAAALIFGLAGASCASTANSSDEGGLLALKDDPRLGEQTDRICFNNNIDSFYNTERDTVVVSTGGNNDYLIEVTGICINLSRAQSLAVSSNTACITPGDSLIVSENPFSISDSGGIGSERCMIASIYRWNKRAK